MRITLEDQMHQIRCKLSQALNYAAVHKLANILSSRRDFKETKAPKLKDFTFLRLIIALMNTHTHTKIFHHQTPSNP